MVRHGGSVGDEGLGRQQSLSTIVAASIHHHRGGVLGTRTGTPVERLRWCYDLRAARNVCDGVSPNLRS
jgi:hypothetical protein